MAFPAHRIFALSFIAILACALTAWAAPRRSLDRARIHGLYHDGEFEKMLRELDAYGKGQCACVRDDSVFAEKHLAVVLAANPATRELGRYHMFRLLDLSPRADLLDMYVGDEVDAVFDKARKEHDLHAKDPVAKASAPAPAPRVVPAAPAARTEAVPPSSAAPASEPAYSDAWTRLPPVRVEANAHPIRITQSGRSAKAHIASSPAPARPRSAGSASRREVVSAQPYAPWDAIAATRPVTTGLAQTSVANSDSARKPERTQTAGGDDASQSGIRSEAAPVPASSGETPAQANSEADSARPAWKQPGLWIGGGAAVAAIAFTFWHAGSDGGGPGKTYAVPASLSK